HDRVHGGDRQGERGGSKRPCSALPLRTANTAHALEPALAGGSLRRVVADVCPLPGPLGAQTSREDIGTDAASGGARGELGRLQIVIVGKRAATAHRSSPSVRSKARSSRRSSARSRRAFRSLERTVGSGHPTISATRDAGSSSRSCSVRTTRLAAERRSRQAYS